MLFRPRDNFLSLIWNYGSNLHLRKMNTLHWVVWVHAHSCKNRSWVFILNSSSEFVGYENSPKKRCTSSFTFPSSSYHSRNESLIITLLNLWGLWIWVQSTNPLPCSCQNACHPDILFSFKLLSISPSLRAGLLFDENLYCKHLVMQPPLRQTVWVESSSKLTSVQFSWSAPAEHLAQCFPQA